MNRYGRFAALVAASVAGYFALHHTAVAQNSEPRNNEPPRVAIFTIDGSKYPRAENGKATIWTAEDLKKKYVTDPNGPGVDHLEWAPPYRISMLRRRPADPATVGGRTSRRQDPNLYHRWGLGHDTSGRQAEAGCLGWAGRASQPVNRRHTAPRQRGRCDLDSADDLARVLRGSRPSDDVHDVPHRESPDDSVKRGTEMRTIGQALD